MKSCLKAFAIVFALQCTAYVGLAQAPAGAPKGATGMCKDGTYATSSSKTAGCRGHKGVKDWYLDASAPAAPAAPAMKAAAPAPAPMAAPAKVAAPAKTAPAMAAAPGGGAGKVWVNTASNVYHCSDDRYYGKTKAGAYMSEADAKAKGAHPDHGNGCSK